MSFLLTAPEIVTAAASDIAGLGSSVDAANKSAAASTTGVVAAAGDEVSAAIASLFSSHAQHYQALSAQATSFQAQFAQALSGAGTSYAATEAANATIGQDLLDLINLPTDFLVGRPLLGPGANGYTNANGVGTPGQGGGILIGNGGKGGDSSAFGVTGGAGGPAGLIGIGGAGGLGGYLGRGGTGGAGGLLFGSGGPGGIGGPFGTGGFGGTALFFGNGGAGGLGGELGGTGGIGGIGGLLLGNGGAGGNGGVSGGFNSAFLGGHGGAGGVAPFLGEHGASGGAGGAPTIPIETNTQQPRPYVDISIGGGPVSKVTLDTGSIGLIVPPQDVNFASLGTPIQTGLSVTYGNGSNFLTETYNLYNTNVNFGNGIVTTLPTQVGVVTSVTHMINGVSTSSPVSSGNAILGVGASNTFSGPMKSTPVQSLPADLGSGLLIDQPAGKVQFGANPLTPIADVFGGSVTTLGVSINGATPIYVTNGANVDSGGLWGDIPLGYGAPETNQGVVVQGTLIQFYAGNTFVFGEHVGGVTQSPVVGPAGDQVNTVDFIFENVPIWLGYSPANQGTLWFDV
jgi:hypothetical protein